MTSRGWIAIATVLLFMAASPVARADRAFDVCEARLAKQSHIDSELGSCGAAWVERSETRLAAAWKLALTNVGGSQTEQGRALLEEQRAWIVFKQKACLSYEVQSAGTLSRFHDANVCLAEVIEDRISELSGNLHGKSLS